MLIVFCKLGKIINSHNQVSDIAVFDNARAVRVNYGRSQCQNPSSADDLKHFSEAGYSLQSMHAFAIPSHIVEHIVPVLIKDGKYQHPSLGLSGITLTANYATEMGLDANTHGVLITDITPGGAADIAGLKETTQQYTRYNRGVIIFGDVITAIDGNPVRTYEDLVSYIFNKTEVGQKVELTILRDGKEMTVTATLQAE